MMEDPFKTARNAPGAGSLSGMLDFPYLVTPVDHVPPAAKNVKDENDVEVIGVGIMSDAEIDVTFIDRHGIERVVAVTPYVWQPTSVSHVQSTGTGPGRIWVGIAP